MFVPGAWIWETETTHEVPWDFNCESRNWAILLKTKAEYLSYCVSQEYGSKLILNTEH